MADLTDLDRTVLEIEAAVWHYRGSKEAAIIERTGLRPTAYLMHLNRLIDTPEALAHDPVTVRRLLDRRARHRARYTTTVTP